MIVSTGLNLVLGANLFEHELGNPFDYDSEPSSAARQLSPYKSESSAWCGQGYVGEHDGKPYVSIVIFERHDLEDSELVALLLRLQRSIFEHFSSTSMSLETANDTDAYFIEKWGYNHNSISEIIESNDEGEAGFFMADKGQLAQEDWVLPEFLVFLRVKIRFDGSRGKFSFDEPIGYLESHQEFLGVRPFGVKPELYLKRLSSQYVGRKLKQIEYYQVSAPDPWGLTNFFS